MVIMRSEVSLTENSKKFALGGNWKYKVTIGVLALIILALLVPKFIGGESEGIQRGSIDGVSQSYGSVAQNEFIAFCNTNVVVEGGVANILVENNEENHDPCTVGIVLDDGTLLYESDTLYPGFYIENAKLFGSLDAGIYSGKIIFNILGDSTTKSTTSFDIKIKVK